jgi:hypothetical protein
MNIWISKYPPPKTEKYFVEAWSLYLTSVCSRPNFREGHLLQLRNLCDCYQEYGELSSFIKENGDTYESEGRNGYQIKIRPEVPRRSYVRSEIMALEKLLGLSLVKDTGSDNEVEDNDFDL